MPFDRMATIELKNNSDTETTIYYYIDWEAYERLPTPVLYFQTTLNQEHTMPPSNQAPQRHDKFDTNIINLDCQENYTFLDIKNHQGHYVGTSLSITCKQDDQGKWWEGDDMFVIDDEPWPPRLHGTGTEDYFNLAWGIRQVDCRPDYGVTFINKNESDISQIAGQFSMYRFHLNDSIPFTTSLHASIEHGHANDCEADYRSLAYWYGRPLG